MKKKIILGALLLVSSTCLVNACGDNGVKEKKSTKQPQMKYNEDGSTLVQYEVKKDNTIEIIYDLEIVNNTNETKYFYLYADMAKEDDNLVKENVIPAYEKKTEKKQVYKLGPNEGKDDYFTAYFRGTHGTQERKETKNVLKEDNLIIEEIEKEDIPQNAKIRTLDDVE